MASADHMSFAIPYSGPGAALRPIAAPLPPKRSISAVRTLESDARAEPHSATTIYLRPTSATGTRCAASSKRPVQRTVSNTSWPTGMP